MKDLEQILMAEIISSLNESGFIESDKKAAADKNNINESYVAQSKQFDLKTELLSDKNKSAHQGLMNNYVETLNKVSAKLDAVDRKASNLNHSAFRQLKVDEAYNLNAAFLHGLFFQNISDLNSTITMDSLSFLRLERDFGSFDMWQKDFIACAAANRNGWAITGYSTMLRRYVNTFIDLHSQNCMVGLHPIVVVDCWEHSYYRDYLSDRMSYVIGMMKELDWNVIEQRVKVADKIHEALK